MIGVFKRKEEMQTQRKDGQMRMETVLVPTR